LELVVLAAVAMAHPQQEQHLVPVLQILAAVVEEHLISITAVEETVVQAWSSSRFQIPVLLPSQAVLPKPHQLLVALLCTP
jgi:hypothetical protein